MISLKLQPKLKPEVVKKELPNEGEQEKLQLLGDYDYNMSQVLKQVVAQIQEKFDLDGAVISTWLNEEGFQSRLEELAKQVYRKHLKHCHLSEMLEELLNIPDDSVETQMEKEFEKCGYVLDVSSNGYIRYCNQHKYAHKTKYNLSTMREEREHKEGVGKNNDDGEDLRDRVIQRDEDVQHFFLRKTARQIVDECIFRLKFNIFLGFTRKLVKKMVGKFVEWVRERYRVGFVAWKDWGMLGRFLEEVSRGKQRRRVFRSKIAFLDRIGDSYCKIYMDHGIGVSGFQVLDSLG